jgi:hypothetical protein
VVAVKTEDLLLIGGAAYFLLSSKNTTNGGSNMVESAAMLSPSPITPSPSGPTSTVKGDIPSSLAFPYNISVKDIKAMAPNGTVYGEYTQNGWGFSGVIPTTAAPAPQITAAPVYSTSSGGSSSKSSSQPSPMTWVSKDTSSPYYGQTVYQNQTTGKIQAVSTTQQGSSAVKTLATNLISSISKGIF